MTVDAMRFLDRTRLLTEIVTTIAVLSTCGVLIAGNWSRVFPATRKPPLPSGPVSVGKAAVRGDPRAPVVVLEYSDYECQYCATAEHVILPEIDDRYIETGKASLAFRHCPLGRIHPHAEQAAEAAVCAGRQGKFWEMHAALFQDQNRLDERSLHERAKQIGLDSSRFSACLSGEAADEVSQDVKSAESLGFRGTPAFVIGLRRTDGRLEPVAILEGAQPAREFANAIDKALIRRVAGLSRTPELPWMPGLSVTLSAAHNLGAIARAR